MSWQPPTDPSTEGLVPDERPPEPGTTPDPSTSRWFAAPSQPHEPIAAAAPDPAAAEDRRRHGGRTREALLVAVGALAVVGVLAMGILVGPAEPGRTGGASSGADATPTATATTSQATTNEQPEVVLAADVNAASVADRVIPSIVYVEVLASGRGGAAAPIASGSGVILDAAGHIVTNRHVVAAGAAWRVVLHDGRTYDATLVGVDEATDLAVLDIGADDLTPIALGSSDALGVGDPAVAVGSPLGLQGGPSLTVGVVSAFGREVTTDTSTLYGMLQTDAAITEGSSGGALVDEAGRLIGITTAVGVSSVGVEGIGFATPVEIVGRVADELIADGRASQPGLGITGQTAYRQLADGGEQPVGVEILALRAGSAASDAGLDVGDVISKVGDTPIDTMDELVAALRRHSAGDRLALAVGTGDATRSVAVVLQDL
jgi:putative serine protease PepD